MVRRGTFERPKASECHDAPLGTVLGGWPRVDDANAGRFFAPSSARQLTEFEIVMTALQRDYRREQLADLSENDPLRVIEMYRRIVGLNRYSMLPGGMDYSSLIEAILDHEAARGRHLEGAR